MARARPDQDVRRARRDEGVLTKEECRALDQKAIEAVDEAVKFADESPFPDLDSLYDDIYVFDSDVPAWWTVDERSPEVHRGEHEREAGDPAPAGRAGRRLRGGGRPQARPPAQEEDEDGGARASRRREPEAEGGAD